MAEPVFPDDRSGQAEGRPSARSYGSVILDTAWAERLGVQRVGGVYRITHRELTQRLAQLQPSHLGQPVHLDDRRPKRPLWRWRGTRAS